MYAYWTTLDIKKKKTKETMSPCDSQTYNALCYSSELVTSYKMFWKQRCLNVQNVCYMSKAFCMSHK